MTRILRSPPTLLARARTVFDTLSMSTSFSRTKESVRKVAKDALRQLTPDQMQQESLAIEAHLRATGLIGNAQTLCIYVHCPRLREVDTTILLEEALESKERSVYAPRVLDSDANMHFLKIRSLDELESVPPFGIREPRPTTADSLPREDVADTGRAVDLVVMPGLAFDAQGRRLGRGGGYYDKFLDGCWRRAKENGWEPPLLVALAFETQLIPDVPVEPHDKMVDILVTSTGLVRFSPRAKQLKLPEVLERTLS